MSVLLMETLSRSSQRCIISGTGGSGASRLREVKATAMSHDTVSDSQSQLTVPPCDDDNQDYSKVTPASVLVVNDDEQLREGYRRLLTRAGIGTLAVPSAKVALELLRSGDLFDVIVSDIVMPDTDGISMLRGSADITWMCPSYSLPPILAL